MIINDFDAITSLACKLQMCSVQFGHQANFVSKSTSRPEKSIMGELACNIMLLPKILDYTLKTTTPLFVRPSKIK
jgi:hypothetical protein